MIRRFLNADDDWIESFRRFWYPKFHTLLTALGAYAVGDTGPRQHVGTFETDPEKVERALSDIGFERNPIACLKDDPHGHISIGSWALRSHDDQWDMLDTDRQLHVTLFDESSDGTTRVAVYAHNEYDWQDRPFAHLAGKDMAVDRGRQMTAWLLENETYLDVSEAESDKDDHPPSFDAATRSS